MKKLFVLALLAPMAVVAQIRFEKGYFIDNSGTRTDCLIRYVEWSKNPTSFDYKLSESATRETRTIDNTKAFGVDNEVEYVRQTVQMERSSTQLASLARSPKFDLATETHFLKVLAKGKSALYEYREPGVEKFFFADKKGAIEQLIYIKYMDPATSKVRSFDQFHTQLLALDNCPGVTLETVSTLQYDADELQAFFNRMDDCNGEKAAPQSRTRKGVFHVKPVVGMSVLALTTPDRGTIYTESQEFKKTSITFGAEIEFIMPTFRNKLGIVLGFQYNALKDGKDLPDGGALLDLRQDVQYGALKMPIGIRYYMYPTREFKIFANAMFVPNFYIGDNYVEYNRAAKFEFTSNPYNAALGLGASYKKFNVEARFMTSHKLHKNLGGEFSNPISLLISYDLL